MDCKPLGWQKGPHRGWYVGHGELVAHSGSPVAKAFTGGDLGEYFRGKCPGRYNSLDFEKYRRLAREENGTIHIRTVNCLVISKLH